MASAKRGVRGTFSESDSSDDELADVRFRVKGVGLFFSSIAVAAVRILTVARIAYMVLLTVSHARLYI